MCFSHKTILSVSIYICVQCLWKVRNWINATGLGKHNLIGYLVFHGMSLRDEIINDFVHWDLKMRFILFFLLGWRLYQSLQWISLICHGNKRVLTLFLYSIMYLLLWHIHELSILEVTGFWCPSKWHTFSKHFVNLMQCPLYLKCPNSL